MQIFAEMISSGSFIIEIGGHIGYITLYFSSLVGAQGRIVVFEPGPNNLPYIRKNIASRANITLVEKAVADFVGPAQFHIESLSGQNNSLLNHYRIFDANVKSAGISKIHTSTVEVLCTTFDVFLEKTELPIPSFVKIDVEGAEISVLYGMKKALQKNSIALMVEVTENQEAVYWLLKEYGFIMFNDSRKRIDDPQIMSGNIFCVKENDSRIAGFSS
jgi:FkbM family methyltransferase